MADQSRLLAHFNSVAMAQDVATPSSKNSRLHGNSLDVILSTLEKPLSQKNAVGEESPSRDDKTKEQSGSLWSSIGDEVVGICQVLDCLAKDEPESGSLVETSQKDQPRSFDILLYGDCSYVVESDVLDYRRI